MTELERIRAEQDAESDAEELGLLLLLAFRKRDSRATSQVSFDPLTGRFTLNGRTVSVRSVIGYLERINEKMARRRRMETRIRPHDQINAYSRGSVRGWWHCPSLTEFDPERST
jgi:hypothetical protein